ncbi:MazG-like family protein [uncultured archaeon]|nr:MazG-like family protein [uncultured archaeon]
MQSDLDLLLNEALMFRDARDWKKFHTPGALAADLSVESNELLSHFVFKDEKEQRLMLENPKKKQEVADEMGDVFHALLLLSHECGIDLKKAFQEKLIKTGRKYPIEKSYGKASKYTEL